MNTKPEKRKEQLIERWEQGLRVLRELTPHQRRRHFDMSLWGHETECGTVACMAGHFGLDPWFRKRKVKLIPSEYFGDVVAPGGLEGFFGENGASLFTSVNIHTVTDAIREIKTHIKWLKTIPTYHSEFEDYYHKEVT